MPPQYTVRGANDAMSESTDITDYFRLYTLDVAMNAEEGSVAQSTVTADDVLGDLTIGGHRGFVITESSATGSNTRIYTGYTAERRYRRGESTRTGVSREIEIDLVDINSVLSRRVMVGNDANRPAETDVARVQWLVSTNEASIIDDTEFLSTANPVAMDAVDYRGQRLSDVIDDCAQQSGKNYFVWFNERVSNFSLYYDFASSAVYSSPLRLTNVLSEVDDTWTFAISQDTQLSRSPDRVFSGAYLDYDGGTVYEHKTATTNAFARRDAVMPAENVKSQAKATARAQRYLNDMDTEEDVITTSVILPAAKVNFLMQGMRVQFKASHLPGYDTEYTYLRALNRSVRQLSEEYYEVKLELGGGGGSSAPGQFQHIGHESPNSEPDSLSTTTLPNVPGIGSLLVAAFVLRDADLGGTTWPDGWVEIGGPVAVESVPIGPGSATFRYKVSEGAADQSLVIDKGGSFYAYTGLVELPGVSTVIDYALADDVADSLPPTPSIGPVTATADGQYVVGFAMIAGINNDIFVDAPWTEMENGSAGASPTITFAYQIATSGDYTLTATSDTTGGGQDRSAGVLAVFG